MQTVSIKPQEMKPNWLVIDASGVVLGRLASYVAKVLRGKHKASYTPNLNCGDHVVIINADKVKLTGKKITDKVYYRHTGFPGGIKEQTPQFILNSKFPERIIEKAVERMLPKDGPLARDQMRNLRVYKGTEHPHTAQNPKVVDFASFNPKNKRASA